MRSVILKYVRSIFVIAVISLLGISPLKAEESGKPLVLQEMTWTDVQQYLKKSDMVIIPIGSTEQHGPHLPLGTDFYEALGTAKMISSRTGVIIAPVLFSGYSVYHSGFPGTLSLKPETMETVLFETTEMLIRYGFRRFMFFNYHGGNTIVERKVIHRINHTTKALAVAIGIASPVQSNRYSPTKTGIDSHAGISETSIMLFLLPHLVRMERAQKPDLTFSAKVKELTELSKKNPHLRMVAGSLQGVPQDTGKGGASHEISSNGVWSTHNPKDSTKEIGKKITMRMVNSAVRFIKTWQQAQK